jgi:uncharacterized OsmC-like protein
MGGREPPDDPVDFVGCWRPSAAGGGSSGTWYTDDHPPARPERSPVTTDDIARAVQAATAHLRAHPEDGRVADRAATVVLEQGLRCRATDPLGRAVVTDMPADLGGADTGPTPGTLLRMALGACAATTLAMRAASEGIPLERVEVVVSSESDHRGLLGLDQVDAGPLELRLRYRLEAPGVPAERLAALVEWAERHSPVSTAARRELPVAVEVDLAEAPPGG